LLMLIADANGYDVRVGDVKNAYLCAFTKEKVWTTCGPEFTKVTINGKEVNMMGRKAIIVKALYGLKSSGKAWHAHLADILRGWGFTPSRFDPDVWYRLDESTDMYEYIGTHTDDLLVVGPPGLPDKMIATLRTIFTIKGGGEPEFHLGCDYKKVSLSMDDRMGKQVDKLRLTEPPEYDPLVAVVTSDKGSVDPPRGKEIYTTCFFDAALGTPETKGRGHTGIILFAGRTPVTCISRRQGTAEGSTYGSEYIAGRQSVEEVMTLRGALRALGVPVRTPTTWYGDNLGMLQSTGLPDSTLKKRHMSIAYHMCREQVAMRAILPIKVGTGNNVADMSTKALDIQPIEHLCKVVFAKPFHTPEDINLRRVKVWFRQIS
jgi:hypothetical protein